MKRSEDRLQVMIAFVEGKFSSKFHQTWKRARTLESFRSRGAFITLFASAANILTRK